MKHVIYILSFFLIAVAVWMGFSFFSDDADDSKVSVDRGSSAAEEQKDLRRDIAKKRLLALRSRLRHFTSDQVLVSGTALDENSGLPIADAKVRFVGDAGEFEASADNNGNYKLAMGPGAYRIIASADNFIAVGHSGRRLSSLIQEGESPGVSRLDLAPQVDLRRNQQGVDVYLTGGARINGVVRDESGLPIEGAIVLAHSDARYGKTFRNLLGDDVSLSDSNGRFEIVVPAGQIVVVAEHEEYAGIADGGENHLYLETGDDRSVNFTLTRGCIVEGNVVDESGMSIEEGMLEIGTGYPAPHDFEPGSRFEKGRFRFTRTGPGSIKLRAWPWKSPPTQSQTFACNTGDRYENVTFVVPNDPPDMHGRLLSNDGEPVPGAYVFFVPYEPSGFTQRERTDSWGEWEVFSMPRGMYLAVAHVPGKGFVAKNVNCPSSNEDLVLGGTGSMSGTYEGIENGTFIFEPISCYTDLMGIEFPLGLGGPNDIRIVPIMNGRYQIDNLPICPLEAVASYRDNVRHFMLKMENDGETEMSFSLPTEEEYLDFEQ